MVLAISTTRTPAGGSLWPDMALRQRRRDSGALCVSTIARVWALPQASPWPWALPPASPWPWALDHTGSLACLQSRCKGGGRGRAGNPAGSRVARSGAASRRQADDRPRRDCRKPRQPLSCTCHVRLRPARQRHAWDSHSDYREVARAHNRPARPQGTAGQGDEDQDPGPQGRAPAAGGLHPRLHDHPEEAELGPAQGGPCAAVLGRRDHGLHPRCRATTSRSTPSSSSAAAG